jgi:hypothetical protein
MNTKHPFNAALKFAAKELVAAEQELVKAQEKVELYKSRFQTLEKFLEDYNNQHIFKNTNTSKVTTISSHKKIKSSKFVEAGKRAWLNRTCATRELTKGLLAGEIGTTAELAKKFNLSPGSVYPVLANIRKSHTLKKTKQNEWYISKNTQETSAEKKYTVVIE